MTVLSLGLLIADGARMARAEPGGQGRRTRDHRRDARLLNGFLRSWEGEAPAEPLQFSQITDWLGRSLALPREGNGPGSVSRLKPELQRIATSSRFLTVVRR